ncbi:hypothetical protein WN943_001266 [Citrus x changshan-huyou]
MVFQGLQLDPLVTTLVSHLLSWMPYLLFMILCCKEFCSREDLESHLASKAQFLFTTLPIPKPPLFLELLTVSHFTQCILMLFPKLSHKKINHQFSILLAILIRILNKGNV